jgi:hypothetical protein
VFEPGDFEDLFAVFVEVDEFELAEKVLAAALEPQEGDQAFAVEETGLFEIEDEVHDLPVIDALVHELADDLVGFAGEVTVE